MPRFPVYIGIAASLFAGAASLRVTEVAARDGDATERRFAIDLPGRREVSARVGGVVDHVRRAAATPFTGYQRGEDVHSEAR